MEQGIRVKAVCLLILNGYVFVADGRTLKSSVRQVEPGNFYRVIGGSINFDENAESAVRREVREEINSEVEDLILLDVIENRFTHAGKRGHDIIFLFKGIPEKRDWDITKPLQVIEDTYEFDAVWVPIAELLGGNIPLYPSADYRKYLT
jgi:ADP-ribose pyrophosphatase YjhB (NUDIX family)